MLMEVGSFPKAGEEGADPAPSHHKVREGGVLSRVQSNGVGVK